MMCCWSRKLRAWGLGFCAQDLGPGVLWVLRDGWVSETVLLMCYLPLGTLLFGVGSVPTFR